MTKLILAAVGLGLLIGRFANISLTIPDSVEFAAFSVMLFGVGLQLGQDRTLWTRIRHGGWKMLLFPLNVVVGSWLGGALAGLILGLSVTRTVAISSGFGWYSLAAVLANQFDGPNLAAVAFIANVLRELLSFVCIPWIARFGKGAPAIAVGGSTSMDTTLPVIARHTNAQVALYAFVSGVISSMLVPVLIPLWLKL